jgi:hypothetical protein
MLLRNINRLDPEYAVNVLSTHIFPSNILPSLQQLEHCDRRFESCSGHGCVSACLCVVLSCVSVEVLCWTDPTTKESYQMSVDREVHSGRLRSDKDCRSQWKKKSILPSQKIIRNKKLWKPLADLTVGFLLCIRQCYEGVFKANTAPLHSKNRHLCT